MLRSLREEEKMYPLALETSRATVVAPEYILQYPMLFSRHIRASCGEMWEEGRDLMSL